MKKDWTVFGGSYIRWDGTSSDYSLKDDAFETISSEGFPCVDPSNVKGLERIVQMIPMLGENIEDGVITTKSHVDIVMFGSIWKALGADVRNIEVKPIEPEMFSLPEPLMQAIFN